MSAGLPYNQHISGISSLNSQTVAGIVNGSVYFNNQETLEQKATACRNALFLTDPHVDRERLISAKGTRVTGTCDWIAHNDKYRAWLNADGDDSNNDGTRLLWISGGPGKGKTMLSIFLTEELERRAASTENTELVFLFCSSQEQHNTAVDIIRGLVYQIITKRPQLIKHVLPYFETSEMSQQTLSSLETLWIIFTKLLADPELGSIFCVLDGLDECEENSLRALLPRVVSLLSGGAPSLPSGIFKLAIVSRDIPGLQGCTRVRLDPENDEKVVGDIERFVSARVRALSGIEGFNDDFKASLQTILLERAEGTFLWVGYAMEELSQKQTCSEIWEALEDLPSGLPAIYGRMLLRIPVERREISRAILRWTTLAARPLQLDELAAATGVQPLSRRITIADATRYAVARCGPILKVQEQDVSLVHQSARDYLLRESRDSDVVLEQFRIEQEPVHLELAQKCLDCIAQSDFQYESIDMDAELANGKPTLLRYATMHWPHHAKNCATLTSELISRSKLFFQKKSPLRGNWWKTYNRSMRFALTMHTQPLLHMACFLDIIAWVEVVLAKKSWKPRFHKRVNKTNVAGNTALHAATGSGSEALVQLLLDNGADIKTKNNEGRTALHFAAAVGNEGVVRLLLANGADINAKDRLGRSALRAAARLGHEGVMRFLFANGADSWAKGIDNESLLHSAARGGNKETVQLLLDSGANINTRDRWGDALLHSAVKRKGDCYAMVKLLIDRGVDIQARNDFGETALDYAARRGNKAVVRLLEGGGADP